MISKRTVTAALVPVPERLRRRSQRSAAGRSQGDPEVSGADVPRWRPRQVRRAAVEALLRGTFDDVYDAKQSPQRNTGDASRSRDRRYQVHRRRRSQVRDRNPRGVDDVLASCVGAGRVVTRRSRPDRRPRGSDRARVDRRSDGDACPRSWRLHTLITRLGSRIYWTDHGFTGTWFTDSRDADRADHRIHGTRIARITKGLQGMGDGQPGEARLVGWGRAWDPHALRPHQGVRIPDASPPHPRLRRGPAPQKAPRDPRRSASR